MINTLAPIIPGLEIGSIRIGQTLDPAEWTDIQPNFPWSFGWTEWKCRLYPKSTPDEAIIGLVDREGILQAMYATPKYLGTLFGCIKTGMFGMELLSLRPELKFESANCSFVDPGCPGFLIKHQEDDLDYEVALREKFDFIGVYNPELVFVP